MKHTSQKKSSPKSSFVQAVLLIVFLVLGYLGYTFLKKGGLTAGLNSFMSTDISDFRSLQSMDEEKKNTLKKVLGGFWVYTTKDSLAPVQKDERLELRDNGIIWQVNRWRVAYPDADTAEYYHVRYGYLNPYSIAADEKSIVCEVRSIRQVFIVDDDTCFGESQVDELWQTRIHDSLLVLNRKRFMPYHGELAGFFPEGMIDLIDKLIINDCTGNFSLVKVVEEHLRTLYQTVEVTRTCDTSLLEKSIQNYFIPVVVEEIFSSIPYFPSLPSDVGFPLLVQPDGTVALAISRAKRTRADHFSDLLFSTMEHWPVPHCDARTMPQLNLTVTIPLP